MERRAGSCRERWWGSAFHVHSWYRHQEVTCLGTDDIWNGSIHLCAIQMTSVTRSQEQSSLQTTRWDRSLTQMRLLTSSPVYTWLGSLGHHWQADHHHHHRLQWTHFIFINAAYTQVYSSAGTSSVTTATPFCTRYGCIVNKPARYRWFCVQCCAMRAHIFRLDCALSTVYVCVVSSMSSAS